MMRIAGIDDIDNEILTLLRENARYSYSEIAEKVGLSRVAVKNRITDMEETGLIKGYQVVIEPEAVSGAEKFMIIVAPKPETYDYVLGLIAKNRMVTKVMGSTGEGKIYAYGVAPSSRDLDTYYRNLKRILTDVRYFYFDVIVSTYKDVDGGIEYEPERREDKDTGGDC